MGVGTRLREARERRGVTLREVAEFTKVSMHTLECIERDDFARLPGGIIARGYLRAFATAVGQNPEEIVLAYSAQVPPDTASERLQKDPALEAEARPLRELLTLLLAVLFACALYAGFETRTQAPRVATDASAMEETKLPPAPAAVAAGDSRPIAAPASGGVYLEIQPTGLCWVSASADGERVLHRLIEGGERVPLSAQKRVVLRVGEPGTFVYTINGSAGHPLGEPGTPVTVTITDENFGAFQTGRAAPLAQELTRSAT